MRIATFNINNVVKRLENLRGWLAAARPDVVCLQELKCEQGAFPMQALAEAGYGAVWVGQKSWNGVAILARGGEPVLTRTSLPGDPDDRQARYVEAAVGGVLIGCIYLPNGNPQPAEGVIAAGVPAVLAGDYNVVPTDFDIYRTRSWLKNALLQPAPRAQYQRLLDQGWTDALRALHPDEPGYTFWQYLREAWPRDAGLRLDHLLISPALEPKLKAAGVDRWVRGEPNASDHAPAWVEIG
jgi:exodeoxyribonuclease III